MTTASVGGPDTVRTTVVHAVTGRGRRSKRLAGLGFVAPFMIVFVGMLVVPLLYAGYLSLFQTRLIGGTVFVGLDNYARALGDSALRDGAGRVALFFVIQVPIMLLAALLFALVIDSGKVGFGRLLRLGIFLPFAVPSVVATLMWGYLYGPDFGPFAQLAEMVGAPAPRFLSSDRMLGSLANISFWQYTGYNMIIFFAALRSIPPDLYEAAAMDGAGAVRIAWSIKLPSLRPAMLITLIFSVIGSFQLFNEPALLQTAAPNVISSSYTPNLYAYNLAFTGQQVNYAAAVSFLLGAVIFAASSLVIAASTRGRTR